MEKKFKVVSLGHAKWILGVKIEKTPQGIQLSQEKYAQDIITKFGMKNAKPVITPVVPDSSRSAKSSTKPVNKKEYMNMVDKGIARHDYLIKDSKGNEIGKVTSGTQSPSLGKAIGLAYVPTEFANLESSIWVEIRNNPLLAKVVKVPFS